MNHPVHAIVMHRFEISADRIFDACLDPAWVGRWMFGGDVRDERVIRLALEGRVGGKFSLLVNREGREIDYVGEFLEIDRPRLLVFTWASPGTSVDRSRVIIEFTPRDHGCDVKLTQVMGAQWSEYVDCAASAWSRMLDSLERVISQQTN